MWKKIWFCAKIESSVHIVIFERREYIVLLPCENFGGNQMYFYKKRRIMSVILLVALFATLPAFDGSNFWTYMTGSMKVYATTAKEKKAKAQKDLKDTNEKIDGLKDQKSQTEVSISNKTTELNNLLAAQKKLQTQISNKQDEITKCSQDLEQARADVDEQYAAMKLRIQFMYENGASNSIWEAILESDGISDMLNRIEYVSDVYQADRDLMLNFQAKVDEVEKLSQKLSDDMESLVALQGEYESKQGNLEQAIVSLQNEKDKYATEIATAKQQAEDYQKTIDEQERIIRAQEAAAAHADSGSYSGGGTGNGGVSSSVDYLSDPSYNPSPRTGVSGSQVVAYALQFVGNPYRWGGNSLTNGVDCSGFVHLVYAHFGISTPRYSQAFKSQGQPVAFANIQAGDVVVYPGHVAIYIGNGCIVEAQSTKAGITDGRAVKCHTITGLRRYV